MAVFGETRPSGRAKLPFRMVLGLPLSAVLIAEGRDADGELGIDLCAVFRREGEAVEHLFAALVEPKSVPQGVDRLAASANVDKKALAGLAVAFDKLSDEHATAFALAVAADPPDVHASWIPEDGGRHSGQYNITRMGEAPWSGRPRLPDFARLPGLRAEISGFVGVCVLAFRFRRLSMPTLIPNELMAPPLRRRFSCGPWALYHRR
jgi:hypothetical protein